MSFVQELILLFFIIIWALVASILLIETIEKNIENERKIKKQQIQIKRNRYELQKQLFLKSLYC